MNGIVGSVGERSHLRLEVRQELQALFAGYAATAQAYGPEFSRLWGLAAQHIQGGKLVRPMLLLETFRAIQSSRQSDLPLASPRTADPRLDRHRSEAIRIAVAVEALHYSFLLHDDVIDGDVLRRGRPNLIGALADTADESASPSAVRHWAWTGGILAGDLLLSSAHQLFARAKLPAELRIRLLDLLEHTIFETTAGEFADVGLGDGVVRSDLNTVLTMTGRKTACYSFELPLRAAVILAGGSSDLETRLSAAGSHLGLAFQLQDDLLSTFGDAELHGKDPYSDLREGKQTAIVCFARMTGAWPNLEADFGDPRLSLERAEHLRDSLRDCGAEDFVLGLIQEQLAAFYEIVLSGTETERIPAAVRSVLMELAARLDARES